MFLGNDRGWEGMLAFLVFDNPKGVALGLSNTRTMSEQIQEQRTRTMVSRSCFSNS